MKFISLITVCILFLTINIFSQPSNDDPCNAIPIAVSTDVLGQSCIPSTTFSWTGATLTAATPNPSCISGGASNIRDVWYKITIPASGKLQISISSLSACFLVAYRGTCTSTISFNELSCSAYAGGNVTGVITLSSVAAGNTIYLRILRPTQFPNSSGNILLCASEVLNIPVIDNSKRIGMGTGNPLAKLDIVGTVIIRDSLLVTNNIETRTNLKARTLQVTDGAGNGNLLRSDSNGKTSWVSPSSIGGVHFIGESYGGGIVYFVTPNGLHGLIAETQDQGSNIGWYDAQDVVSAPGGHSTAGQNYTDWRLPTKKELYLLYLQRLVVGGFVISPYSGSYWSSTASAFTGYDAAWFQDFYYGYQNFGGRTNPYYVRAVRTF